MSIRFGAKTIGYGAPAPFAVHRHHESPKMGDSQGAIVRASGGALDINQTAVHFKALNKWLAVAGHWGKLKQDGYTHCKLPGQALRRITRAEYKKYPTYQKWVDGHGGTVEALNSLRKKGGGRKRKGIHDFPMTWEQQVKFADRCDTALTPEVKSRAFATIPTLAKYMQEVCKKYDFPLWPMTLLNMWGAQRKCANFRTLGEQFSLIFGRFTRLARGTNKIKNWKYKPTRIWGPASARRWLRS